jgi:hypothetical protein
LNLLTGKALTIGGIRLRLFPREACTSNHGQRRIFRERRIGQRKFAKDKFRSSRRFDSSSVHAIGTQPCANPIFVKMEGFFHRNRIAHARGKVPRSFRAKNGDSNAITVASRRRERCKAGRTRSTRRPATARD